jgi:PAS domain S-box-containing protein
LHDERTEQLSDVRSGDNETDIADSKLAEATLRLSEEKFRKVFETSPNCLNINRLSDGMYVALNPGFTEIIGYTEEEILGKTSVEKNIWYDLADRTKWVDELTRTGKVRNFETRFRTKDGNVIYALVSATLIELEGVQHVISITTDITEKKIAEDALQASEEKFRNIFEYSIVGKSITTFDGRLKVNKAFCDIVGYSEEELNRLTWQEITHPEDVDFKRKEIELLVKGVKKFSTFESRYIHKNGNVVWVEIRTVLQRDSHGKPLYFITTLNDITERKLAEDALRDSEEKLSTLFGSMNEMVVMHELVFDGENNAVDYRIIDCNNAFTRITGIKKEDAIGRLATEVYQTEIPPYLEIYAQVAITGKSYEYDTYYAPMDKHFIVSVVSPRKNVFATITTEITAVRQIQDEVIAKNKELENYLYVASHDLRSPLVNIQGFSQRLQKQSDDIKLLLETCALEKGKKESIDKITNEDIPRTLNFIVSNVLKMDSLINSLLHISRTGRLPLMVKRVDMNKLFKSIVSVQNYQITELGARLVVHELEDCYGDEGMLNQLFSNIIDNALKYRSCNRELVIGIDSEVRFNKVVYRISDTGLGISTRNLSRIWDVFYRVNSLAGSGEGIGLSIAKTIANKHRGKIWVESEEGTGSTFYVELQLQEFTEQ